MSRSKGWGYSEKKLLKKTYGKLTIKELEKLFPNRSRESINNKVKRLKRSGELTEGKDKDTIKRAYEQRGIEVK
jgi:hypothetical protein